MWISPESRLFLCIWKDVIEHDPTLTTTPDGLIVTKVIRRCLAEANDLPMLRNGLLVRKSLPINWLTAWVDDLADLGSCV